MQIKIQCPNPQCSSSYTVDESIGNQRVKCKRCNTRFVAQPTIDQVNSETEPSVDSNNSQFQSFPAEFGRYRVQKLLGRGGMGCVYRAQDTQLRREVALKIPSFGSQDDYKRAARFLHEGHAAAALQHSNICTVYDAGEIDGRPFIAMELVSGTPLSSLIDEATPAQAVAWCAKIATALEHAHQKGIVHRDLKPANVVINESGEPKLMDFGLAKLITEADPNQSKLTHDGAIMGTPSYMSPEQARGDQAAIGPATDIYSLGVMLFELIVGSTPYAGAPAVVMAQIIASPVPTIHAHKPELIDGLDIVCKKAMAKLPADRFQSASEMAGELARLERLPSLLRSSTTARRVKPQTSVIGSWKKNWPVLIGAGLAGLFVLAAVLFTLRTKYGDIVIELSDPTADVNVSIDGQQISLSALGKDYKISAGEHGLQVSGNNFESVSKSFTVREGRKEIVKVDLKPLPAQSPSTQDMDPDRLAIERVLTVGGVIYVRQGGIVTRYSGSDRPPPGNLELLNIDLWHNRDVTDEDIDLFSKCTHLDSLSIGACEVTDSGIRSLTNKTQLTTLNIGETKATIDGIDSFLSTQNNLNVLTVTGEVDSRILKHVVRLPLVGFTAWYSEINCNDLAILRGKHLEFLVFEGCNIGDDCLPHLVGIADRLTLGRSKVTDEGLKHFDGVKLEYLSLANALISDSGVEFLLKMKGLGEIDLRGTKVSSNGVARLRTSFPKCKVEASVNTIDNAESLVDGLLNSHENSPTLVEAKSILDAERAAAKQLLELNSIIGFKVGRKTLRVYSSDKLPVDDYRVVLLDSHHMLEKFDDEYVALIASFRLLSDLGLPRCDVTDRGFDRIPQIEQLESFSLYYPNRLTPQGMIRLLSRLKVIRDLSLEGAPVADHMLSSLAQHNLKTVSFAGTEVGDRGIEHLNLKGKKIFLLSLSQTNVTDRSMPILADCVTDYLRLNQTAISDEGLRSLKGHRLQELELNETKITDAGIRYLTQMEMLSKLSLNKTSVSFAGVQMIQNRFPGIKVEIELEKQR